MHDGASGHMRRLGSVGRIGAARNFFRLFGREHRGTAGLAVFTHKTISSPVGNGGTSKVCAPTSVPLRCRSRKRGTVQIGRASCRERVAGPGGGGAWTRK